MNWVKIFNLSPYILSLFISFGVSLYTWHRRTVKGAKEYSIVVFAQLIWIFGFICELIASSLEAKIFWDNFQWLGSLLWPVAFLMFAVRYSDREVKHPFRTWLLLLIFPLIFLVMVYSNEIHHLIRINEYLIPNVSFPELHYDFKLFVWLMGIFGYSLVAMSIALLLVKFFKSQHLYRRQLGIILLGIFFPLIGSILILSELNIGVYRDITPFTSAIGNLIVMWGLFRFKVFDLVPVARDQIIENLNDMVLVFDIQGRIVYINPAVINILNVPADTIIGSPVSTMFSKWADLIEKYQDSESIETEIDVNTKYGLRHYDLKISRISDKYGDLTGRIVILHDITERVQMENELKRHRTHLEKLVEERTFELKDSNIKLKQEIVERKRAEEQVQNDLKEKVIMLKEIHHRVKNNLQIVSSLFRLQSSTIKNSAVLKFIKDSQNRIRSMALIHDQLYHSSDFTKIDMGPYLRELCGQLCLSYGFNSDNIDIDLNIYNINLSLDEALPCSLLLNELISNTLRHAFPLDFKSKPHIFISMKKKENNEMELAIEDNGIGLPEGFKIHNTKTLGMQLVITLAEEQLGGTVSYGCDQAGTKFEIRFPMV